MSKTRLKNGGRVVKTIYFELKFLIIYEGLFTLKQANITFKFRFCSRVVCIDITTILD